MPQLDPQFFLSQLFWLSIFFALFYLCISKIIAPKLESLFSARNKLKETSLSQADQITKEIEKLKALHAKKGAEFRAEIQQIKEEAELKFEEYSKSSTEKLNKRLNVDLKRTEEEIAKLKSTGFDSEESEALLISQAQKIIDKISGLKTDKTDLKKFLKDNHA
jgi:F-type H+-transporting ATPase subunit b